MQRKNKSLSNFIVLRSSVVGVANKNIQSLFCLNVFWIEKQKYVVQRSFIKQNILIFEYTPLKNNQFTLNISCYFFRPPLKKKNRNKNEVQVCFIAMASQFVWCHFFFL